VTNDTSALLTSLLGVSLGGGLTWALTGRVLRYALRANLIDRPNARSSHTTPTPRGGGIAIAVVFLALLGALGLTRRIGTEYCIALLGSSLLITALGFLDDRGHVPARVRFSGHVLAAAWALVWLRPLSIPIQDMQLALGVPAMVLFVFYIVWSINLFNFMDGIDGIASVEAIGITLGGAFVWWLVDPAGAWFVALIFAACVAGFLVWNFPPARIFMGDAGSGFIGLVVAVLSLWSASTLPHLFWAWLILSGCFIVDATTTLVCRVALGERFYEAHRNHAYQYAARRHGSHRVVTLTVLAINSLWLLPWAIAVALRWIDGVVAVGISFAPLLWLALHLRAGNRKAQDRQV
jgi:Fuc2NAc and GlcNAc transferase